MMHALSQGDARASILDAPTPAPAQAGPISRDDVPRGILAMAAATLCLALSSALTKYQVALHPVGEVMFMRSISSLAICSLFVLPRTGLSVFRTERPKSHIARGLSQSISQTFTVLALWLMPLAGATAISFSAPIWSALISIIWLKERPGPARWAFLMVGFIGVLIVAHPNSSSLQIGALFALANAVMYGSVTVAVRGMTKTESADGLLMWQMVTVAFFHCLLLPFGLNSLSLLDVGMLVCSGLTNAIGQWFWTRALRLGPATAVSPFYYLTIVWALAIGYLAWGDIPTLALILGSSVVASSGLLLLWHEARTKRLAMAPGPAVPASPHRLTTWAQSLIERAQHFGRSGSSQAARFAWLRGARRT
jgi:drug/metabolite transporter (DMT)-like permease